MFSNDRLAFPNLAALATSLTAALAAVLLAGCERSAAEGHARAEPVVPVVIASVERRTVPITVRAVGSVEAIASVAIVSRVDGPIERVFVADGQDVVAGQPLVQLDPEPLRIQVRMSEANLQRDSAKESDARSKEERGRPLLEQHYISPDDYAQLKSNLDSAIATVAGDRATLDQAKLQLTYTTIRAPVAGKIGHVALQTGSMVRASSTEPLTTLNSIDTVDVSFTVPERNLQAVRRAAEAHQAMVTLTDAGAPMTHATSTATAAVNTKDNSSTARASANAGTTQHPADTPPPVVTAALSFIDNTVDRTSGTLRLRARVDNKNRALWPGQFVTVNLVLGSEPNVVTVPNEAIQQGPTGPYVFIVKPDSSVEQRPVDIARVAEEHTIITGLEPGERVVTDGQSRLTPGTHVSIRAAGAKADTTATT